MGQMRKSYSVGVNLFGISAILVGLIIGVSSLFLPWVEILNLERVLVILRGILDALPPEIQTIFVVLSEMTKPTGIDLLQRYEWISDYYRLLILAPSVYALVSLIAVLVFARNRIVQQISVAILLIIGIFAIVFMLVMAPGLEMLGLANIPFIDLISDVIGFQTGMGYWAGIIAVGVSIVGLLLILVPEQTSMTRTYVRERKPPSRPSRPSR